MRRRHGWPWHRCGGDPPLQCPTRTIQTPSLPSLTAAAVLQLAAGLAIVGEAALGVAQPRLLRVGQSILEADRQLQRQGWRASPDGRPDGLDRERAGNGLASLSACSGSGFGFCRYDYRRGASTLSVITVPGAPGETPVGKVLRWSDGSGGRSWGLCSGEGPGSLVPCGDR